MSLLFGLLLSPFSCALNSEHGPRAMRAMHNCILQNCTLDISYAVVQKTSVPGEPIPSRDSTSPLAAAL